MLAILSAELNILRANTFKYSKQRGTLVFFLGISRAFGHVIGGKRVRELVCIRNTHFHTWYMHEYNILLYTPFHQ